jgi:mRNA interferase RelE/StbE
MPEKKWKVELSDEAIKYLKKLTKSSSSRILDNLEMLETSENPLDHKNVRPLAGKLRGFYRLRVGGLRIIFELDHENRRIGVHLIVPRGNAYKKS